MNRLSVGMRNAKGLDHLMKLQQPLDKIYITQRFGERPEYYAKYGLKGHDGVDYRTRYVDSPLGRRYVQAAADATVEIVRADADGYGTHIRLRHDDQSMTIYAHLTKSYVSKGNKVKAGQRIGLTGNSGDSSAPHLHFEYRPTGWEKNTGNGFAGAVDPLPFLS